MPLLTPASLTTSPVEARLYRATPRSGLGRPVRAGQLDQLQRFGRILSPDHALRIERTHFGDDDARTLAIRAALDYRR